LSSLHRTALSSWSPLITRLHVENKDKGEIVEIVDVERDSTLKQTVFNVDV
jgi:hypothetical protein